MPTDQPATAALCGPCSVGDHQGCRGCSCAYCADLRGTATAATVTPRWEFALRPRQGGKTTLWHETLVRAINAGEHAHNLAVDGTQCWGGDDRCPAWREQGSKDADQPR